MCQARLQTDVEKILVIVKKLQDQVASLESGLLTRAAGMITAAALGTPEASIVAQGIVETSFQSFLNAEQKIKERLTNISLLAAQKEEDSRRVKMLKICEDSKFNIIRISKLDTLKA